jgi:RNA polymerase-binding protein DksA
MRGDGVMKTQRKTTKSSTRVKDRKRAASRASASTARRKNRFTPEELEGFRHALLNKRRELVGDTESMLTEASHKNGRSSGMPLHMAELASDTWEQEFTFGLIENRQTLLREIEEALERIDDGTYGICEATKRRITKVRLRAIPWARYCIEYARNRELGVA